MFEIQEQNDSKIYGQVLAVRREYYTHYGIGLYDTVIEFSGINKTSSDPGPHPIQEVSFEEFSQGDEVRVVKFNTKYTREKIVDRAKSKIGENGYDLFDNNCEHFVTWVVSDRAYSIQGELGKLGIEGAKKITEMMFNPDVNPFIKIAVGAGLYSVAKVAIERKNQGQIQDSY